MASQYSRENIQKRGGNGGVHVAFYDYLSLFLQRFKKCLFLHSVSVNSADMNESLEAVQIKQESDYEVDQCYTCFILYISCYLVLVLYFYKMLSCTMHFCH